MRARFADQNDFTAVWLPERHFHAVGGFSPNSSLLAAALARETTRLQLRGGSVVLPLHHPVRVAEEWSLVDNLSNGRAAIFIATGWHPERFRLVRAGGIRRPPQHQRAKSGNYPAAVARRDGRSADAGRREAARKIIPCCPSRRKSRFGRRASTRNRTRKRAARA